MELHILRHAVAVDPNAPGYDERRATTSGKSAAAALGRRRHP